MENKELKKSSQNDWNGFKYDLSQEYLSNSNPRFSLICVSGFSGAIRGMREPMDSHKKSDSFIDDKLNFCLGDNDMDLCKRLIGAGSSEHRKFLRMIHVQVEIECPRYWWEEMATYKVGTTFNSQSTMHKLLNNKNEIKMGSFSFGSVALYNYYFDVIKKLNCLREKFLITKDNNLLLEAKQMLPEGYMQARVVDMNYEVVRNICMQRKNHKLREWKEFVEWAKSLPYADELIFYTRNNTKDKGDETQNGEI